METHTRTQPAVRVERLKRTCRHHTEIKRSNQLTAQQLTAGARVARVMVWGGEKQQQIQHQTTT